MIQRVGLCAIGLLALSTVSAEPESAPDRLDMEGIEIHGNSELPKALYIVPWKEAEETASTGKPVESLTQELLNPLEREAFQRRLKYVEAGDR